LQRFGKLKGKGKENLSHKIIGEKSLNLGKDSGHLG
jgi:hypothetical protein